MLKVVRCPESANLELVEYLDSPLGALIRRCTSFRPACALRCTRGCAAQLDFEVHAGSVREHDGLLRFELDPEDDTLRR